MEKINVQLYGGKGLLGGKETPLEAEEIFCDKHNECSFYKEDCCLCCRSLFALKCEFGETTRIKGYTSRAAKYWTFKSKYNDDPLYGKLSYPKRLIGKIGNTIYLTPKYVHIRKYDPQRDTDKFLFKDGYSVSDPGFITSGSAGVYIPESELTNALLKRILDFLPNSIMGGRINSYQQQVVPDLLQDLKVVCPEIYSRFINEFPEYHKDPVYIGKVAYVETLRPGCQFTVHGKKDVWTFDGEYVTCENYSIGIFSPWCMENGSITPVKIKVNHEMTVEITSEDMVCETTKLKR